MAKKESFILYLDFGDVLDMLTDEEAGVLFKAIFSYEKNGEVPELDRPLAIAFAQIKAALDRNRDAYKEKCERNREVAKTAWQDKNASASERKRMHADACGRNQTHANEADNDSDSDNDSDNERVNDKANRLPGAQDAPVPSSVIDLPLNTGTYAVLENDVKEWGELYPAVDVMQELRAMKGWLDANPQRRKTKNGIRRFINAWLSREQDKGGAKPKGGANKSTAPKRSYEFNDFERAAMQANLARLNKAKGADDSG